MKKLLNLIIFVVCVAFAFPTVTFASGTESLILGDDIASLVQPAEQPTPEMPDPTALKLNWWDYFEVKNSQELSQRISASSQNLYTLLARLSPQEQETATAFINNIMMHFSALLAIKQQPPIESPTPQPFLQTYTIEQQLELNHKIKIATLEKKNEEEDLENLRNGPKKCKSIWTIF